MNVLLYQNITVNQNQQDHTKCVYMHSVTVNQLAPKVIPPIQDKIKHI